MKKSQQNVLGAAVLILLFVLGAVLAYRMMQTPDPSTEPGQPGVEDPSEAPYGGFPFGQGACESAGGTYNECGSACRGAEPGTPCILICVAHCECTSDAQCPDGLSCGDYVDGVGVCTGS